MKILISAGELDKELNANTKIILQLAEYMANQGNEVAVCGICYYKPCSEIYNKVKIEKFSAHKIMVKAVEGFEEFAENGIRNNARKQFIKKHPLKSALLFVRYNKFYIQKIEQPLYLKKIEKYIDEFKPDAVILPYKPINSFETVVNANINVNMFAYQLDPWGLHRIDNADNNEDVVKKECAAFEKVKHIFTTPVLLRQYKDNELYKKYISKMTAVDFPNIKNSNDLEKSENKIQSAIEFKKEDINILFCGIVADSFRSPEFVLKALEPVFKENKNVKIYFMGTNNSDVLNKFMEKYPHNVFFKEKVDNLQAAATMQNADILLNISNKIDNQVPSKIFDYFSVGKPILNLQRIENCPAEEYLKKYPIGYTIKEGEECDKQKLKNFIENAKGKNIGFNEVEKIYKTATVKFVADSMLDVIKSKI